MNKNNILYKLFIKENKITRLLDKQTWGYHNEKMHALAMFKIYLPSRMP